MSSHVKRNNPPIDKDTRCLISTRYKRITKAINIEFWNTNSEIAHSRYVGSYGRGTAVSTSDLDVLMELPNNEYDHFTSLTGNGQSRLLQAVKDSILETYPTTDVKGDGQVVIVKFSDGMKFEILPTFRKIDWFGNWDGTYQGKPFNPKDRSDLKHNGEFIWMNDIFGTENGYYYLNMEKGDTFRHYNADHWWAFIPYKGQGFTRAKFLAGLYGSYN